MVDRVPVGHQRGRGRRPFVGQHDRVAPFQDGGDHCRRRDDRGDGHVPVEEPQLPRATHEGIDLAGDVRHRQPGERRRVLYGGEAVPGRVDDAQRGARVVGGERRDGHDGVDPPAEGDERPPRLRFVRSGWRGLGLGSRHRDAAQVDVVAVRELGEAVHVVAGEERAFGRRGGQVAEVDHPGGRRLVVRDARDEEEDPHGRSDRRISPIGTRRKGEALREAVIGGRIGAGHPAGGRVDDDPVVAELVGRGQHRR